MISRQIIKQNSKLQLGNSIFGNTWMMALLVMLIFSVILSVGASIPFVPIIIEGALLFGISSIFLDLVRGNNQISIEKIFYGFQNNFGRNFAIGFLSNLFVVLWSLLFVIPGIVKSYAYSMAFFVANDHPEYTWRQCIDESQRITQGHKWELFVLDLSFIGWYFVGALCLGIGTLWVIPYHQTAKANYYQALISPMLNS